jgi:fructose-specific phosphotransferase system component IIB
VPVAGIERRGREGVGGRLRLHGVQHARVVLAAGANVIMEHLFSESFANFLRKILAIFL